MSTRSGTARTRHRTRAVPRCVPRAPTRRRYLPDGGRSVISRVLPRLGSAIRSGSVRRTSPTKSFAMSGSALAAIWSTSSPAVGLAGTLRTWKRTPRCLRTQATRPSAMIPRCRLQPTSLVAIVAAASNQSGVTLGIGAAYRNPDAGVRSDHPSSGLRRVRPAGAVGWGFPWPKGLGRANVLRARPSRGHPPPPLDGPPWRGLPGARRSAAFPRSGRLAQRPPPSGNKARAVRGESPHLPAEFIDT